MLKNYVGVNSLVSHMTFDWSDGGITPVEPGHSTGWRNLPWFLTTECVGGRGRITFEDGNTHEYADGEVCAVAPGVTHIINVISQTPVVSRWSHVSFSTFGTIPLSALLDIPVIFDGEVAARVSTINAALAVMLKAQPVATSDLLRAKALGFELAALLIDVAEIRQDSIALIDAADRLAPALEYMQRHLGDAIKRDDLAATVSMSSSRFAAIFRQALGQAPMDYLQSLRMARAQQLLVATDLPIAEIAAQCGFPDPFHFSRLFHRNNNAGPRAYRNTVRVSLG